VVTVLSAVGAAYGIGRQIRAASRDRDKNAKDAATLKLAEFVIASRQPAMARDRLNILERIDPDAFGADREVLAAGKLAQRILPEEAEFPGVERHELQVEVLRLIATNPNSGKHIVEASTQIFPKEKEWLDRLRPLFP
jgi:hypothetical protein